MPSVTFIYEAIGFRFGRGGGSSCPLRESEAVWGLGLDAVRSASPCAALPVHLPEGSARYSIVWAEELLL